MPKGNRPYLITGFMLQADHLASNDHVFTTQLHCKAFPSPIEPSQTEVSHRTHVHLSLPNKDRASFISSIALHSNYCTFTSQGRQLKPIRCMKSYDVILKQSRSQCCSLDGRRGRDVHPLGNSKGMGQKKGIFWGMPQGNLGCIREIVRHPRAQGA